MDASDMLDIVHYYFEEDSRYSTAEEAQSVSALRTEFYSLYGKTYSYGTPSQGSSGAGRKYISQDDMDLGLPDEFSPREKKPFIPATDFNPDSAMPFGSVLDAPLG